MEEKSITITKTDFLKACAEVTVTTCEELAARNDGQPDLLSPLYCAAFTVMLAKELFGKEETNGTAE